MRKFVGKPHIKMRDGKFQVFEQPDNRNYFLKLIGWRELWPSERDMLKARAIFFAGKLNQKRKN